MTRDPPDSEGALPAKKAPHRSPNNLQSRYHETKESATSNVAQLRPQAPLDAIPNIQLPLPSEPFVTLSNWSGEWAVMIESNEPQLGFEIDARRYRIVGCYPTKAEALRIAVAVSEKFGGLDIVDRSQPDLPGAA